MQCLVNVDVSWNNAGSVAMGRLFDALRTNNHIKSLNVSFNPVAKTDKLDNLRAFMRTNTVL